MPGHTVDVKLLRDSIERCIMADRQKTDLTLTPRDLYVKSNPGLLGAGTDVTNPRDWYCSSSARKLLRSFVSQYNNVKHERLSGEALSKKVAFYVNFPALLKESSSVGGIENEQLGASSLQCYQGEAAIDGIREDEQRGESTEESVDKNKDNNNGIGAAQVAPDELLSSIGRMKSFMFTLPAVEGSVGDDQESSQRSTADVINKEGFPGPNPNSVSLPKLSTRTVTFNIEKRREGKQSEDPFDLWLAGVTNEVQSAKSYLNRTKVGTRRSSKRQGRHPEASVRRKLESLSAQSGPLGAQAGPLGAHSHAHGASPRNSIPDQYLELLLPKHQTELTEAQQFYDQYPWRQKSVLNLKLDFGREKKSGSKATDGQRLAESSEGGESESGRRRSKRRTMSSPLGLPLTRSQGQQQQQQPVKEGDILGFFPHSSSDRPLMKVISASAAMGLNGSENQNNDVMAIPVEALEEHLEPPPGGLSDPGHHSNTNNCRFVYKAPGDKFLLKPAQNTKTNIVTLGLTPSKEKKAEPSQAAPFEKPEQGHDKDIGNDVEHDGTPVDNSKKTPKQEEETSRGKVKSKAALRRYKRLEVFGERKPEADAPEVGCEENGKQPEIVVPVREKSLRTSYKPMARPPTYRLDEREYEEGSKVDTVTLKVKVSPTPRDRKGHVVSDVTGSEEAHAQIEDASLTNSVLVIEKMNTERENKPQNLDSNHV